MRGCLCVCVAGLSVCVCVCVCRWEVTEFGPSGVFTIWVKELVPGVSSLRGTHTHTLRCRGLYSCWHVPTNLLVRAQWANRLRACMNVYMYVCKIWIHTQTLFSLSSVALLLYLSVLPLNSCVVVVVHCGVCFPIFFSCLLAPHHFSLL